MSRFLSSYFSFLYHSIHSQHSSAVDKIAAFQFISLATWPGLAAFGHYTMARDYPEHVARHHYVNKEYPYMANPQDVMYKWGTPCTLFDFECSYKHRKSLE